MKADIRDINQLSELIRQLWPDMTPEEAREEIENYIVADNSVVFTYKIDGICIGLALCSLRNDYVEGCSYSPVGYLEGIVVDKKHRRNGIAESLCKECEAWAKSRNCIEIASDCELTNTDSLDFHLKIGFKEQNRIICFKKEL